MTQISPFQRDAAYIGGMWIAADGGKTIPVVNPATGETLGAVPRCGRAETARAIEAAVATAMQRGLATQDVGGSLGTAAAGEAIVEFLRSQNH